MAAGQPMAHAYFAGRRAEPGSGYFDRSRTATTLTSSAGVVVKAPSTENEPTLPRLRTRSCWRSSRFSAIKDLRDRAASRGDPPLEALVRRPSREFETRRTLLRS